MTSVTVPLGQSDGLPLQPLSVNSVISSVPPRGPFWMLSWSLTLHLIEVIGAPVGALTSIVILPLVATGSTTPAGIGVPSLSHTAAPAACAATPSTTNAKMASGAGPNSFLLYMG